MNTGMQDAFNLAWKLAIEPQQAAPNPYPALSPGNPHDSQCQRC
jgi:2-polyprenyl-6-methoxyphenol hydroxylase-like FAD-dependent oxidoreductase